MMLIKWMSASSAADEWEVLSSHLQYLWLGISHVAQWYLRATLLSEELILKIQMGFLQPRSFFFFLSSRSLSQLVIVRQIERLSPLLNVVLKWAVLRNWVICSAAPAHGTQTPSIPPPVPSPHSPGWFRTSRCSSFPSLKAPGLQASRLVWVNSASWKAC